MRLVRLVADIAALTSPAAGASRAFVWLRDNLALVNLKDPPMGANNLMALGRIRALKELGKSIRRL